MSMEPDLVIGWTSPSERPSSSADGIGPWTQLGGRAGIDARNTSAQRFKAAVAGADVRKGSLKGASSEDAHEIGGL